MAQTIFYRQCRLVKKLPVGTAHQTSWLPESFAIVGKVLKLRNGAEDWGDGWVVESVSEQKLAEDQLPDPHRQIKDHRKATGDSLPKQTTHH
jgi:hypothetical protein